MAQLASSPCFKDFQGAAVYKQIPQVSGLNTSPNEFYGVKTKNTTALVVLFDEAPHQADEDEGEHGMWADPQEVRGRTLVEGGRPLDRADLVRRIQRARVERP